MLTEPPTSWRRLSPGDPIVVIGAGLLGCSAAYHLLAAGARDVTLIDRYGPGDGTSSAGAGFVALWAAGRTPTEPSLAMQRYALEFYGGLHASGHDIGYRNNGNLIIAQTEEAWREHVAAAAESTDAEPGTRVLGPAEIARLTGVVSPEAVHAGLFMPSAIQIETARTVQAVVGRITALGGVIRPDGPVEGFAISGDRVRGVLTPQGTVKCAAVIVAAGAWTNSVLRYLDVRLPLLRVIASRLITEPAGVPATMPTIQCYDYGMWIREKEGRFTWGSASAYRSAYSIEAVEGPIMGGRPRSQALLDLQLAEQTRTERIVPGLAGTHLDTWFQGMPVYTPDAQLIIGGLPEFSNVITLAGDNESGVVHGPGMGRIAAELIRGEPPFADPHSCRPERFQPADFPDEEAVGRELAANGIDRISDRPSG
ncbi:MAG: NAD(P)/FAD-dependent oxidoreductase [Streptosporangiaceae bacterium]